MNLSSLKQILNSDVCISDLDDTDTVSSAKKIAWDSLKSSKIFNSKFWSWCLTTGWGFLKNGKSIESEAWRKYVKLFLRDPKQIQRAIKLISRRIERLLYPGVQELYSLLPERMYKLYLTRNILPIGRLFAKFLNFDQVIAEVFDKAEVTAQFVEANPQFKGYFVKGDSQEDEAILEVLEFYKRKGKIENVVSCYITNSHKINPKFDFSIGGNYLHLVEILKKEVLGKNLRTFFYIRVYTRW